MYLIFNQTKMYHTTPLSTEELEKSYEMRTIHGASVSEVWMAINDKREVGNKLAFHNFIDKINKYLINRHKILGLPVPVDLRKDAWAKVKSAIEGQIGSLTIGDVQVCNNTMYIKGTVQEIVETQFGYIPENVIKGFS